MLNVNTDLCCCALIELDGLGRYKSVRQLILDLCMDYADSDDLQVLGAIVIFTGASSKKRSPNYSERVYSFIQLNGLGQVYRTEIVKNPNSGNYVTMYTWVINHEALKAWWNLNK